MTLPNPSIDPNSIETPQPQLAPVSTPKRLPGWRLWLPLVLQAGLIAFVPAQDLYTSVTGTLVTLKTAPVDPYDIARGYSQTLRYEVSNLDRLKQLPGGDWFDRTQRGRFYVVLQAPAQPNTTPPQPWQPVRISDDRPTHLADNQVALRGVLDRGQVVFGLEQFYMPEDQRQQINKDLADGRDQIVTQAKVDAQGNAVLINLWVRDRALQF